MHHAVRCKQALCSSGWVPRSWHVAFQSKSLATDQAPLPIWHLPSPNVPANALRLLLRSREAQPYRQSATCCYCLRLGWTASRDARFYSRQSWRCAGRASPLLTPSPTSSALPPECRRTRHWRPATRAATTPWPAAPGRPPLRALGRGRRRSEGVGTADGAACTGRAIMQRAFAAGAGQPPAAHSPVMSTGRGRGTGAGCCCSCCDPRSRLCSSMLPGATAGSAAGSGSGGAAPPPASCCSSCCGVSSTMGAGAAAGGAAAGAAAGAAGCGAAAMPTLIPANRRARSLLLPDGAAAASAAAAGCCTKAPLAGCSWRSSGTAT